MTNLELLDLGLLVAARHSNCLEAIEVFLHGDGDGHVGKCCC